MSLTLFIGNKNYSSSSMRVGVLLRAFEIDVYERFIRFDSFCARFHVQTSGGRIFTRRLCAVFS